MKNLLGRLLGGVGEVILSYIIDGLLALVLLVEMCGLLYLGYLGIYAPIADNPGARDGMGLIIVMGVVFIGSLVVLAILKSIQVSILQKMFPWWHPPME